MGEVGESCCSSLNPVEVSEAWDAQGECGFSFVMDPVPIHGDIGEKQDRCDPAAARIRPCGAIENCLEVERDDIAGDCSIHQPPETKKQDFELDCNGRDASDMPCGSPLEETAHGVEVEVCPDSARDKDTEEEATYLTLEESCSRYIVPKGMDGAPKVPIDEDGRFEFPMLHARSRISIMGPGSSENSIAESSNDPRDASGCEDKCIVIDYANREDLRVSGCQISSSVLEKEESRLESSEISQVLPLEHNGNKNDSVDVVQHGSTSFSEKEVRISSEGSLNEAVSSPVQGLLVNSGRGKDIEEEPSPLPIEESGSQDNAPKRMDGVLEVSIEEDSGFEFPRLPLRSRMSTKGPDSSGIAMAESSGIPRDVVGCEDKLFVTSAALVDDCMSININWKSIVIDPADRDVLKVVRCEIPLSGLEKEESLLASSEISQAIPLDHSDDQNSSIDVVQHGSTSFGEKDVCISLEGEAAFLLVQGFVDNLNSVAPSDSRRSDNIAVMVDDGCVKAKKKGRGGSKSTSVLLVRRSNPKRAAALTTNNNMSCQPGRTKSTLVRCSQGADSGPSCLSTIIRVSSKWVTRKRSFLNKPARCSPWGVLETLMDIFEKNSEYLLCEAGDFYKRKKKWRQDKYRYGKKNHKRSREDLNSQVSKLTAEDGCCINARLVEQKGHSGVKDLESTVTQHAFLETVQGYKDFKSTVTQDVFLEIMEGHKDLESTVTQDNCLEIIQGYSSGHSSRVGLGAVEDENLPESGASPDSVLHPVIDSSAINSEDATSKGIKSGGDENVSFLEPSFQNGSCNSLIAPSEVCLPFISLSTIDMQSHVKSDQTRKGNNFICNEGPCSSLKYPSIEENLQWPKITKKERQARKHGRCGWKKLDISITKQGSVCKKVPVKLEISGLLGISEKIGLEKTAAGDGFCNLESRARLVGGSPILDINNLCQIPSGTEAVLVKGRSHCIDSSRRKKQFTCSKKETLCKMNIGSKSLQNLLTVNESEKSSRKGNARRFNADEKSSSPLGSLAGKKPSDEFHQPIPTRIAWVLCDDCQKWRCIPAELADIIDQFKCRWTCKDNRDKAFSDCSIPQEKTNAEINAELQISDGEDCLFKQSSFKATEGSTIAASPKHSWRHIKSNIFLHRNRRTQAIDEVMVCHCKRPLDGSLGCGEECLNRMLNIECVQGTCPSGDLCSNQQFQKRKYAMSKSFPCGKKGYGLRLLQNVSKGQFLIEYVGEVLDMAAYEARQKYYASRGQKHFYFMTLNGGEVIDACAKGNLGRFINHSCDPNCRTEKWMVNGEVCIGLFAIRDIKKGEELTFDYKFVRVFGAAATKCVCGSSECRGIIGVDSSNAEVIVQADSDDEFCDPLIAHEDSEDTMTDFTAVPIVKHEDVLLQYEVGKSKCDSVVPETMVCLQNEEMSSRVLADVIPSETSETSCTKGKEDGHPSDIQLFENFLHTLKAVSQLNEEIEEASCQPLTAVSQTSPIKNKATLNLIRKKPKNSEPCLGGKASCLGDKTSHSYRRMKMDKSNTQSHPEVKSAQKASRQFDGVEEKLNLLLDENGGISKLNDAPKGYLKLLCLTAAEGDNATGCAVQSMRVLSLILDAILKTKSHLVLKDIIAKNGLQMLHNIIKLNRCKFSRIPIIRKLLKVLEFLAMKEILTPENMTIGPPCSGKESFRESILILTKHNDTQVQQAARNFLHKYVPRDIRRVELTVRDANIVASEHASDRWMKPSMFMHKADYGGGRESHAIVCVGGEDDLRTTSNEADTSREVSALQMVLEAPSSASLAIARTRKRKSRWDQLMDLVDLDQQPLLHTGDGLVETQLKFIKCSTSMERGASAADAVQTSETSGIENSSRHDEALSVCKDAPPGFGAPCEDNNSLSPSVASDGAVDSAPLVVTRTRKRKSRWDNLMDSTDLDQHALRLAGDGLVETQLKFIKCSTSMECGASVAVAVQNSETRGIENGSIHEAMCISNEGPPGCGAPCEGNNFLISSVPSDGAVEAVMGIFQEAFLPRLAVSYGIPVPLMHKFGTLAKFGNRRCLTQWDVAPGMPFEPSPTYQHKQAKQDDQVVQGTSSREARSDRIPHASHCTEKASRRPGFGAPCEGSNSRSSYVPLDDADEAVVGILQEAYLPQLAVSYGIPVSLMHKFGTRAKFGNHRRMLQWDVAPGVPFKPSLPPTHRHKQAKRRDDHVEQGTSSREARSDKIAHASPYTEARRRVSTGEARDARRQQQYTSRLHPRGPGDNFDRPFRSSSQNCRRWPPGLWDGSPDQSFRVVSRSQDRHFQAGSHRDVDRSRHASYSRGRKDGSSKFYR